MNEEDNILLLDEEYEPILFKSECAKLRRELVDFIKCYAENKDKPVKEWLSQKMQEQLPDKKQEEIIGLINEIIKTLKFNEEQQASLSEAVANGRSKENWFASTVYKATSGMLPQQEIGKYFADLDSGILDANEALYKTIITQAGTINQNPNLDGFYAEQYHAQTFNMNAAANGSPYRAKVLLPKGNGYAKNSVDIVIVDNNDKIVRRYQSKYCKDAKATEQAFEHGNYRGQQKLVPDGQESKIRKKCTTTIEAPDGTKSNPLSKLRAEQMRDEAQSGNWSELNYNEYKSKDLLIGIGRKSIYASLQGAAVSASFDVLQKLCNGEEIEPEEVVEKALTGGTDFGIKAAAAGAVKVMAEKGMIKVIPKGTPVGTIANIVHIGIENIKIWFKVASGELSGREGTEKMMQTTVATTAGIAMVGKGAAIGATAGTVFGPIGATIGRFVGGTVGYMAGSTIGETIVEGVKKVIKPIGVKLKSMGNKLFNEIRSCRSGIVNFLEKIVM